jgi:hypothetical protein
LFKRKIKQIYTNITEDDLLLENGEEGKLLIRLENSEKLRKKLLSSLMVLMG